MKVRFLCRFVSHILDDFIFVGPSGSNTCLVALQAFLQMCSCLSIPINEAKTVKPSTRVEVHGVEVDTVALIARLPSEKLAKARLEVSSLRKKKRASLKQFQSTIGFLNFACRVVRPGRAFLRRLIEATKKVANPNNYIRVTSEVRKDLSAWLGFLEEYNGVSLLLDMKWVSSETFELQTDAAASVGYGAILKDQWCHGFFEVREKQLHITILELYPILLSVAMWRNQLRNKCVLFMCDNEAVFHILNSQSSKDKTVMKLVRTLVVLCMQDNILLRAKHVAGVDNVLADLISRQRLVEARKRAPYLQPTPLAVPDRWKLCRLLQDN